MKELSIKDGKLYQTPVKGIENFVNLRFHLINILKTLQIAMELNLKLEGDMIHEFVLFSDKDGNGLSLIFNLVDGEVVVDRSKVGKPLLQNIVVFVIAPIAPADTTARIFIDNSVFEIFINDGEMVFSGRVFLARIKHIFRSCRVIQQGSITHCFHLQTKLKKKIR